MLSASFAYPNYLWFLMFIPFFIFVYFFGLAYNKKRAFVFANFEALERFYGLEFFSRNFLALYLNLAILVFIVLSLSGMHIGFTAETSAYNYVLLIDNSGSMSANDISPTRFLAAKISAKSFIDFLPLGVKVGVIGFSGEADVYQKVTNEKILINMGIDNIEFGEVEGTNIYNAVIAADRLLDNVIGSKFRSVVILSDGQVNIGEAPQIIAFAERNEIVLHTIAVGSPEGGLSKYNTVSKADIDFLKSLSFNTGGNFFRVEENDDLNAAFDSMVDIVEGEVDVDISLYLLIIASILFILNWVLFNLRFKTFP